MGIFTFVHIHFSGTSLIAWESIRNMTGNNKKFGSTLKDLRLDYENCMQKGTVEVDLKNIDR